MEKMTVAVIVRNGGTDLERTLESLVNQSVEDFEILILDCASSDSSLETAKRYEDEYNGIRVIALSSQSVSAARNEAVNALKGGYIIFLDCGDELTERSVESVMSTAKEDGADIITGRCWRNGDVEHSFDKAMDILAVIPDINKLESTLLRATELGCIAFSRKLFELYSLRFAPLCAYSERLFIMQSVMTGVKISGCSELVLEKSVRHISEGLKPSQLPTRENFLALKYVFDELSSIARAAIEEQTGAFDGDEAYYQELIYTIYNDYLNLFYRRYWYMDEQVCALMKDEFERYAQKINPARFKKLAAEHPDLRLPYIYTSKSEAADEPEFSIIFDLPEGSDSLSFLRSLYNGLYPFFELLVSEERFSSPEFPDEFRKMENISLISDSGFHTAARRAAKSKICLDIRNAAPLDERVLRDTAASKAPAALKQYIFMQKRQTLSARKSLKDKGLNLN